MQSEKDLEASQEEAIREEFNRLRRTATKVRNAAIEEAALHSGFHVCIRKTKIQDEGFLSTPDCATKPRGNFVLCESCELQFPLWVVEIDVPKNLRSVSDRIEQWICDTLPNYLVACFTGKHALGNLNERVIQGCLTILNKVLKIGWPPKGAGKSKSADNLDQLQVHRVDLLDHFRIEQKGQQLVVAGRANWRTYSNDLRASTNQLNQLNGVSLLHNSLNPVVLIGQASFSGQI